MEGTVRQYIAEHQQELLELTLQLCQIPAPTGKEDARAAFCRDWLRRSGAGDVTIDRAKNVICTIGVTPGRPVAVFLAHLDTVFPDITPFTPRAEGARLYCPGAFDDTANVAALLMAARYVLRSGRQPRCGVVFAANTCEEGLGNLKGSRALLDALGEDICQVVSFDLGLDTVFTGAVGSARYRICLETAGGHSYLDFGKPNAIAQMAELICALYRQPVAPGATFNVGQISGGTSVNTIAQRAELMYEYRAETAAAMAAMEENLRRIAAPFSPEITLLGRRPGTGACRDPERQASLLNDICAAVTAETGHAPRKIIGSTDCNIPFSRGIPAACVGLVYGSGAHTRQEYILPESLAQGLGVALRLICPLFNLPV